MIALLQRVSAAQVEIDQRCVAKIEQGILALVAVQAHDTPVEIERCCERILNYRIFEDEKGKMNKSLHDMQAGLLLVPQFTLLANTNKGNRPSFSHNVCAETGQQYFQNLIDYAQKHHPYVQQGHFGADMQVSLTNDGPATFWLEV